MLDGIVYLIASGGEGHGDKITCRLMAPCNLGILSGVTVDIRKNYLVSGA